MRNADRVFDPTGKFDGGALGEDRSAHVWELAGRDRCPLRPGPVCRVCPGSPQQFRLA